MTSKPTIFETTEAKVTPFKRAGSLLKGWSYEYESCSNDSHSLFVNHKMDFTNDTYVRLEEAPTFNHGLHIRIPFDVDVLSLAYGKSNNEYDKLFRVHGQLVQLITSCCGRNPMHTSKVY